VKFAFGRGHVTPGDGQVDDQAEDDGQEECAGADGSQPEAAVAAWLREIVAYGCAERASQDIRDPEGKDGAEPQPTVGDTHAATMTVLFGRAAGVPKSREGAQGAAEGAGVGLCL